MLVLRRLLSEPARRRTWSRATLADGAVALLTVLLIAGAVLYSAVPTDLPHPVPASAPVTVFSSARALNHIRAIARQPRPIGSPANAAVRDYLVRELAALGLQPEVQSVTVARESGDEIIAGRPQNVLARMKGIATGKAFKLCASSSTPGTSSGANGEILTRDTLSSSSIIISTRYILTNSPMDDTACDACRYILPAQTAHLQFRHISMDVHRRNTHGGSSRLRIGGPARLSAA